MATLTNEQIEQKQQLQQLAEQAKASNKQYHQ